MISTITAEEREREREREMIIFGQQRLSKSKKSAWEEQVVSVSNIKRQL